MKLNLFMCIFLFEKPLKDFSPYSPILLTLWFTYLQTDIKQSCMNLSTRFFYISNTIISNARLKLAKNQANDATQYPEVELLLFENYSHSSSRHHPKIIGYILRNKQTNKCACIHEITRLIIMNMKMKMTKRSHRYDTNRPTSRYWQKQSMIILICIKQHLSNIWSSIHEKVKQHWGWVEKKRCL